MSSAEAEFYAMVDGVQRARWAETVARELGIGMLGTEVVLATDSEAAKIFVSRRGLGKMRHIEVRNLWLQEEVRKGQVRIIKVRGTDNPADLMTKYLSREEVVERLVGLGIEWAEVKVGKMAGAGGRAEKKRWSWADATEEEGEDNVQCVARRSV